MVLPAAASAGAARKIVLIVCELRRINAINLRQALALILPVNSLSLLQHIGFQSPHLGSSSAVCLEVAFMRALCLRAAKPKEEHGGGTERGGAEARAKRGLRLCTREKSLQAGELQLAGVRAQQPSSHGVDAFEQRGLCLSSEGSATGESAGVCLACNPKNASLPLKLKGH